MPGESVRAVPNEVLNTLAGFMHLQRFWFGAHYALGLAGSVTGVVAAIAQSAKWPTVPWMWGLIAGISTALVTFLGAQQKATKYKVAYYRLVNAKVRFEQVGTTTIEWLLDEHKNAQDIAMGPDENRKSGGG